MSSKGKLVLIDGTALAYRNHFSMIRNPLRNSKGVNTSALYGTLNSLEKVIREQKPDYIIVAFDSGKPTFRHEKYPEYKSTRAKMPDELAELLPVIKQAIEALNIPVVEIEGVEADDVVGTLAKRAKQEGFEVLLYTGDKDFLQVLEEGISMLAPGRGNQPDKLWTVHNAHEKFGVRPEQVLDFIALAGDTSDNIPGVPGIGEKTAAKLLNEFGSLDEIYKNLDKIKPSLRKKLEAGRESAYLSRELARIRTDLPIDFDWEKARLRPPDEEKLLPILQEYELATLIKKLLPSHRDTQKGDEEYVLIKSLDQLRKIVDEALAAGKFAVDTETTSEDPMRAQIVGISISYRVKTGFYIPLGHTAGGDSLFDEVNLPLDEVRRILSPLLTSDALKIGQNIKYDLKVLRRAGFEISGKIFDTMIAAYLLDPGAHQHGLDFLALKYLGYRMTSFEDVAGKGKKQVTFDRIPPENAAAYSCEDVDITLRLYEKLSAKLEELSLDRLFYDIEMPLVWVLADMEMTGICLDLEKLEEIRRIARARLEQMRKKIYEIAGEEFNIDSHKQLSEVLFVKLGLPPKKKTKTGYSTDAEVLSQLAQEGYEIAQYIVEYREMAKLLSTYIEALPRMINPETGRIHTTFHQTGTATGRLSSSDPNLQNIPIRGELGGQIREAFVPREGWLMMSADYSQIELRLMAHFSEDPNLLRAFHEGLDVHSFTASLITGLPMDQITPELRRLAKTVNFGIMYGLSAHGLAQQLGITHEEAQAFIDNYFRRYPKVKECIERIIQFAQEHGYVETIMGRRRYFPEINSDSYQMREAAKRAAINTPFQGSAADIIKSAMIKIFRRLNEEKLSAKMLLQIHDELVFEFPPQEQDALTELVKTEMEGVVQLKVPLVVDIGIGKNWAEAH